jgi:anti-sigma regulatory factor (Ser/Thr protein kinase)
LNGSLAGLAEPVRLLVSELVTNSVKHAGAGPQDPIDVALTASADKVRVEVGDGGAGFEPRTSRTSRTEPGGFGLMLVDKLADRWGIERTPRPCVWFEIDRPS